MVTSYSAVASTGINRNTGPRSQQNLQVQTMLLRSAGLGIEVVAHCHSLLVGICISASTVMVNITIPSALTSHIQSAHRYGGKLNARHHKEHYSLLSMVNRTSVKFIYISFAYFRGFFLKEGAIKNFIFMQI